MKKIAFALLLTLVLGVACTEKEHTKKTDLGDGGTVPELKSDFNTYGLILDTNDSPIKGVSVSDGFNTVLTNEQGKYEFNRNSKARFVYYSTPAQYEINVDVATLRPMFYQRLRSKTNRYDFRLKPLAKAQTRFNLICIGDPQIKNSAHLSRFANETMVDLKAHVATMSVECYGITLGDISYDAYTMNDQIANSMKRSLSGLPVFQTIGNHDHERTISDDWSSKSTYEDTFGPSYYSFNRGVTHIISLDNVLYTGSGSHGNGFTSSMYQWIKDDLSSVPTDRMVIVCMHVPIRGQTTNYFKEVLELLSSYSQVHIMSAHSHTNLNYTSTIGGKLIYEHTHGTSCGAWWNSTVNCDGAPNGYAVYEINGASIKNWYYKGTGFSKDFQLRLHRGSEAFTGGSSSLWTYNKNGVDQIVANVWNRDPEWTVEVYEDDVKSGTMSSFSDYDAWSVAYHMGALRGSTTFYKSTNHMYYYTLTNPSSRVSVKAIDRFGNVYTQDTFTTSATNDYPIVK